MTDQLYKIFNLNYTKVRGQGITEGELKSSFEYLKNEIAKINPNPKISVELSCGIGRWATVPWIRVFFQKYTPSAKKGLYIVYLFSSDGKSLYLTLNQGTTDSKPEERILLKEKVFSETDKMGFSKNEKSLPIGDSKSYGDAAIYYKKYSADDLPNDLEFKQDLLDMISIYEVCESKGLLGNDRKDVSMQMKNTSEKNQLNGFEAVKNDKRFTSENFISPLSTRYITALLAKPFVILTGNSGTGKTKIATDFSKWLEKKTDTGFTNHLTVPVGADWTDNSKILGYFNPLANNGTGEYVKTEILTLIEAANDNPDIRFFLILDEMNLSHVERYFADFLSAMESGKPILLYKKPENCESTVPEKIYLPKNLFVTGTVNIDETTYMFSPKVLDRANVIEFKPEQDSVLSLLNKKSGNTDIIPDNNGMAEAFMNLANDVRTANYDFSDEKYKPLSESFKSLYDILEPSGFEFAYRTTKEIALYVSACQKLDSDFKLMESIDEQLLQKILPKIHGNRKQIGTLLEKLETFCAEKSLPLSLAKVQKMKVRLENYQYASFI